MKLRVFVVDDNVEFLAATTRFLERDGLEVVGVASTGAEALRGSELLNPDVILVDVDLGPESGFDVVERLILAAGERPVILISALARQDVEELIETSSAIGFISKSHLSAEAIIDLLGDDISPPV